ncbi:hypothetical protein [Actinocrispum sp. NPDC049592]|uniref:hypothetical protein n=1 Tax=Actinocrispum sp. NPDC049592 TaxID=3154835 RepID=UPI0034380875
MDECARPQGIAGYSRGAEVTQLAISHSNVFKAASSGEGGYWLLGAQIPYAAEQAREVFGGSPVDPAAVEKAQNLDWFDYWLTGRRDPDPAKKAQYARWDGMRP